MWDSGVLYESCIYQKFLIAVAQEGSKYHTAMNDSIEKRIEFLATCSGMASGVDMKYSTRIESGPVNLGKNASMNFLHVDGMEKSDVNENSLVIMLQLGSVRILLPGDSGGGERADPNEMPLDRSVEKA